MTNSSTNSPSWHRMNTQDDIDEASENEADEIDQYALRHSRYYRNDSRAQTDLESAFDENNSA